MIYVYVVRNIMMSVIRYYITPVTKQHRNKISSNNTNDFEREKKKLFKKANEGL